MNWDTYNSMKGLGYVKVKYQNQSSILYMYTTFCPHLAGHKQIQFKGRSLMACQMNMIDLYVSVYFDVDKGPNKDG